MSAINRLLHRKCAIRIFIHESHNFRNSLVRYAHSFVSKVLQRVNKIRTKHFLWCNLFVIYIRPISCNKPSKKNSVFFVFHMVKYRIIFHRFIAWKWPYIYHKLDFFISSGNQCFVPNLEEIRTNKNSIQKYRLCVIYHFYLTFWHSFCGIGLHVMNPETFETLFCRLLNWNTVIILLYYLFF